MMPLTYVCSPLSAPTRAEMLANAAKACTYSTWAEKEFGGRAVAPHAYLPYLLDDRKPEERALALEFDLKLLAMCDRIVVYGTRISSGMKGEIEYAQRLGIPVIYRQDTVASKKTGGEKIVVQIRTLYLSVGKWILRVYLQHKR